MLTELQCDYEVGMFSNESAGEPHIFTCCAELLAACHHEAAHAVTMFALGQCLESVGVSANYQADEKGKKTVGYGGQVQPRSRGGRRQTLVDFDYRPLHFRRGLTSAAGPAGELRYRHEQGLPQRLLGATMEDHQSIDGIAKCLEQRGRDRFAFRRLVWRAAQRVVAMDNVWAAICDVADELNYAINEDDVHEVGYVWGYVAPRDVYRICRRHGITRGTFLIQAGDRYVPIFPQQPPACEC